MTDLPHAPACVPERRAPRAWLRLHAFVHAVWAGFAQIYFQPSATVGMALFAILLLADRYAAFAGLMGAASATLFARALRLPRRSCRLGLYSYNGALLGIALGALFATTATLYAWLLGCAAASVLLTLALARHRIPALTGPFVAMMFTTHLLAAPLGLVARPTAASCFGEGFGFAFCAFGQVVFIAPLALGLLMWYVLALRDERTTGWALVGGVLGWLLTLMAAHWWPAAAVQAGGIGVNGVLAALGLGVFGFRPAVRLAGVTLTAAFCVMLGLLSVPYYTLPFNLALWSILLLASMSRRR